MPDLARRKADLVARLALLQARLGRIEGELTETHSPDWEDHATERELDEVLIGMGEAGTSEVRQIRAALARIASQDYGTCARCGGDIAPDRLDALPWTPLCLDCAKETHPSG